MVMKYGVFGLLGSREMRSRVANTPDKVWNVCAARKVFQALKLSFPPSN